MINNFKIGADPEFVMVDKGNLLHRWPGDEDEITTAAGEIGPDHDGAVAELRPKPAIGTYALVKRIRSLLIDAPWGSHRKYHWLAGPLQVVNVREDEFDNCNCDFCVDEQGGECDATEDDPTDVGYEPQTQPLGGHIHLDIRANAPHWNSVVDALDAQYQLLEKLELFPKADCDLRRERGYGQYRSVTCNDTDAGRYEKDYVDANLQENAEQYHMEFRTPPSWLNHPRLAMLSLTSAKLAAADPTGTLEALQGKPVHLNTIRNWYERYRGKDANADRVMERLLHGTRISQLQFDTDADLKDTWNTLDF